MVDAQDRIRAFRPGPAVRRDGASSGPLAGLTFGVKDLIDVAGDVTGAGNPRWYETHAPAQRDAPCVSAILQAGATLIGKTITDELAYSLNGDNVHYGTPVNVAAPGRVPGGSSSGSAAAVAAGLCDFALATDSGGSIRIPASYCGLHGIRTTHGRIPLDGLVPLMPSFDTVGWLASSPDIFAAVGRVLLGDERALPLGPLLLVEEAFAEAADGIDFQRAIAAVEAVVGPARPMQLAPEGLELWRMTFRLVSAPETWAIHGAWIETADPGFSPAIAERFAFAKSVSPDQRAEATERWRAIRERMLEVIGATAILCIPSAPGPAPRLDAELAAVEAFRQSAQRLTCIAGLAGLPQVSLPLSVASGCPIGLSLVGPPGSDLRLLDLVARVLDQHPYASKPV